MEEGPMVLTAELEGREVPEKEEVAVVEATPWTTPIATNALAELQAHLGCLAPRHRLSRHLAQQAAALALQVSLLRPRARESRHHQCRSLLDWRPELSCQLAAVAVGTSAALELENRC